MTVKRRKYSGNERPTSRDGQNLFAEARFRYISRFCFIYFTITEAKKIVPFTEYFVM